MRPSVFLVVAFSIIFGTLGVKAYSNYLYSERKDELRLVADRAVMELKECHRAYSESDPRCRQADNVATTALKAWNAHAATKSQ